MLFGTKMCTGKHRLSIVERLDAVMVTLGPIGGVSINFDRQPCKSRLILDS